MPSWEFAALVFEGATWHLVKPANVEPAAVEFNKAAREDDRRTAYFGTKWMQPTTWKNEVRMMGETYEGMLKQKAAKPKAVDDGSDPVILFSSVDLLILINMAGADGWEITGGIGLADGQPGIHDAQRPRHETRWRIMRREL
jgi:hypothetical protein